MSSSKPIRVGFVGLSAQGWASMALAPPLLTSPLNEKYSLTALSTSSHDSAKKAADAYVEKTGVPVAAYHGANGASDIAGDATVDLVAVSVKAPLHKELAMPAVLAKKDVFVEWPLGKNLQESISMAEAAREAGIRTIIGLQGWQAPIVRKIREAIAEGKIGRVLAVTYIGSKPAETPYFGPNIIPGSEYALDPENGATVLSIFIGHALSTLNRMVGTLASVSTTTGKWLDTAQVIGADGKPAGEPLKHVFPDHFSVTGALRDHPGAVFTAAWRGGVTFSAPNDKYRPSMFLLIDGDKGSIRVDGSGPTESQLSIAGPSKFFLNGEEVPVQIVPVVGNTSKNWEEFAKGADGEYPTWDDAVVVHKQVDAIWRSSQEGRRVEIEL